MFNFAIQRAILDQSPIVGIKPPAIERRKDRVLSADEIRVLWTALWDNNPKIGMNESTRMAILFQLATACRTNESLGLPWSEIDGDWWTIPAERAKNGNPHRVPLTPIAKRVLARAKDIGGQMYVFPSPRRAEDGSDRPMVDTAATHAISRVIRGKQLGKYYLSAQLDMPEFSSHDLRRTAATHMAFIKVPRFVISKILNHVDRQITAIYDRHNYDDEKLEGLTAWSMLLEKIIQK